MIIIGTIGMGARANVSNKKKTQLKVEIKNVETEP